VIGLALVAVGLPAMRYLNGDEPGSVLESTRFPVSAPDGMMLAPTVYFGGPAISPDGKKIVFAVLRDGQSALYLRSLDSVELRPVKGGRDAHHPFWSPDSRQIGFFTEGKLKTLNLTNGALQTLCDDVGDARDNQGKGATWNQDNDIVFAMPRAAPLYRIPAQGGTRTQITTLDSSAKEESHRWPFFLPDGRHFLYLVRGKNSGVYVGSLDSEKRIPVMADQDSSVIYAPPGYLLFVRDESLMAQPFDAKTMVLSGKPFRVDGPVAVNGMISRGLFSASGNGRLVFYSPESADLTTRIVRFSRDGQEPGPGSAGAQYRDVRLSPDGLKLAYSTRTTSDSAESTLWLLDVSSGRQTSFSADMNLTVPHSPVWSPDGNQVYFAARAQNGHDKIYRTRPESTEKPELFLESEDFHLSPLDLSRDGKFLLLQARPFLKSVAQVTETKPVAARSDLWFAPLTAPGTAKAFMATAFIEKEARFSPNGQWVVYASDESGSDEIYIRAFPSGQMKTPVSTGGGASPKWSGDGASIVYMAPDRTLISVSLTAAPNAAPRLGAASSIMSAPGSQVPRHQGAFWLWDMSADAHTFYFVVDPVPPPMIVALNWLAGRDN
jgi:Tol biopolymer transport system component